MVPQKACFLCVNFVWLVRLLFMCGLSGRENRPSKHWIMALPIGTLFYKKKIIKKIFSEHKNFSIFQISKIKLSGRSEMCNFTLKDKSH